MFPGGSIDGAGPPPYFSISLAMVCNCMLLVPS